MQGFAAAKLNEFEQGKISRRTLIETLTLAVTSMCAADANAAQAAAPRARASEANGRRSIHRPEAATEGSRPMTADSVAFVTGPRSQVFPVSPSSATIVVFGL